MNVTQGTRTENIYSFTLSQADLDRYLADPQAWAADTKAQLRMPGRNDGGGVTSRKKPRARARKAGRRHYRPRAVKTARPLNGAKAECDVCHKLVAASRLNGHMIKMHPTVAPVGG